MKDIYLNERYLHGCLDFQLLKAQDSSIVLFYTLSYDSYSKGLYDPFLPCIQPIMWILSVLEW